MTGVPDPFAGHLDWTQQPPKPIVPTAANMVGSLRGRRVIVGLPGNGWRADLRADEKVVQGSRTYVPVMPESEWYRAEDEKIEVFAPLIPLERVWAEDFGISGVDQSSEDVLSRLVSLDEPPRRPPVASLDADYLTGRRVVHLVAGAESRDLRAVTELHTSGDAVVCARVVQELDWYRWGWRGHAPRTLEVPARELWLE